MTGARVSAVRRLAGPVSILTVRHESRVHGTTASTTTLVSTRPLILATSLRAGSVLGELAIEAGWFSVNVLGGGQAELARWFADSRRPPDVGQFAGLAWRPDPLTAAPLLEGTLAHYSCRGAGRFVVGDHEVLLGRVVECDTGSGDPLLSFAGDLRTLTGKDGSTP
nr:flavin reductase family protein [Streptomyces sp. NBC_00995]WSW71204.1 flavin reductase family protein [Streptomyces sp. NBC_00995]